MNVFDDKTITKNTSGNFEVHESFIVTPINYIRNSNLYDRKLIISNDTAATVDSNGHTVYDNEWISLSDLFNEISPLAS